MDRGRRPLYVLTERASKRTDEPQCGRVLEPGAVWRASMKIRRRAFLTILLPALCLLGPATVAAAPTPSPDLPAGSYIGTVNMTTMHNGSTTVTGASVEWS